MPYGLANYWFFRPDRREVIDITLGVPLSEDKQPRILGYLALPRLLVQDQRCAIPKADKEGNGSL
jgi:hypothetical protein